MVRVWCHRAACAVLLVIAAAAAPAHAQVSEPYDGCPNHPESCDPSVANPGPPRRGQEPVRQILFAHMLDLLQRAPLTVDPPHPTYEPDLDRGFLMPTLYTDVTGQPCCKFENNQFVWFLSGGPLGFQDGVWLINQAATTPYPMRFASETVTGYFYLSPRAGPDLPDGPSPAPGVMPDVGVYMRMEVGRIPGSGILVAEGDVGGGYRTSGVPVPGGGATLVSPPGADPVYEFKVPMRLKMQALPLNETWGYGEGFVVSVVPYQIEHAGSETGRISFTQSDWRVRSGALYPPRLVLDIHEPLRSEGITINQTKAGTNLRWGVSSLLGSYALKISSIDVRINGAPAPPVGDLRITGFQPYGMSAVPPPVVFEWFVPHEDLPFAEGRYVVEVSVTDRHETFAAHGSKEFVVRQGRVLDPEATALLDGQSSSSLGALAAVVGVAAVAALRRRRA